MQIEEIAIERLQAHPANANVMPEELLAKLAAHLARTDRYPPIVVRPFGDVYQMLDGHHRVLALQRLGRTTARCVVWAVDDAEALVLLTTLNGLRGRDDPRKRGAIVAELAKLQPIDDLAGLLPESARELEHLLTLDRPAPLRPPPALEDMPVAVHFFLLPAQRRRLERRLAQLGGSREAALMQLVEQGGHDDADQLEQR